MGIYCLRTWLEGVFINIERVVFEVRGRGAGGCVTPPDQDCQRWHFSVRWKLVLIHVLYIICREKGHG